MVLCSIEGCGKKHEAGGYCPMHRARFRKYGDPLVTTHKAKHSLSDFWSYVEKTDLCWLFNGKKSHSGYGVFHFQMESIKAHRFSYELHNDPIPEGMHVLHKCDVRNCVNPEHLYIGTHQQNMNDMKVRGRADGKGRAILTPQQVIEIRGKYQPKIYTQQMLADEYGVSTTAIYSIIKRENWNHI